MERAILVAALIMSLGMLLIPFGDTAGKLMTTAGIAPLFVAWARYGVGAVLILPFTLQRELFGLLRDWRIWLRALLQCLTIATILTALSTESIADTFGAFFLGPIVSYGLSVWLLNEQRSTLRLVLLVIGLVGVFMVVKPGFGMTPGLGWALLSGCFYGMYLTASRWVAPLGRPTYLLSAQLLLGTALLAPFGLSHLPSNLPLGLLLWSAMASLFGNLFLILAYARARASLMAPFVYVQLIGAMFYGVVVFGDWPDTLSTLGLIVIFVAGFATLFIRQPTTPPRP